MNNSKKDFRVHVPQSNAKNGNPSLKDVFMIGKLILKTGIRTGELRSRSRSSVSFEKAEMTISNYGKQHALKLEADALDSVISLLREAQYSPYVLGLRPETCLRQAVARLHKVCNELGHPKFGLYSLRRAYIERLANSGVQASESTNHLGGDLMSGGATGGLL